MIWTLMLSLAHGTVVDRVAAVVNNEVIALSEVYELGGDFVERRCPIPDPNQEPAVDRTSCVLDAELEILDVQIRRVLVRQELRRLGLSVTVKDVDRTIDATVREYPSIPDRDALKAEVEKSGKTWSQYREEMFEYLRTQTFQGRILAPRVIISDDELRDRFTRESRKLRAKTMLVEGFAIPVPTDGSDPTATLDRVDGIISRINQGEISWQDAMATYDEADMASNFGREVVAGELIQDLDVVINQAEVGPALGPVLLNGNLFVLSVRDTGERAVEVTFEDAKEQIRNVLFQERLVDAEEEWYQRARREAAVEIRLQ